MTSVVSFYRDISYISFITLFLILVIQLSSIYSFWYVIIIYILFICTSTFLSFYTLIGSLSNNPRFAHPDIWCFISLIRCSLRSYALRGSKISFYLIMVFLPSLFQLLSFWFAIYIRLYFYSSSWFIWHHVWTYMCCFSDHDLL